jgi:hypothetical protein
MFAISADSHVERWSAMAKSVLLTYQLCRRA